MEEVFDDIYNEMLDVVFGVSNQKLTRSEFIDRLANEGKRYLQPGEIKKMVDQKRKEKGLAPYLEDKLSKKDIELAKDKDGDINGQKENDLIDQDGT